MSFSTAYRRPVVVLLFGLYLIGCPPPPSPQQAADTLLQQFDTLDLNNNGLNFSEARSGLGTLTQAVFDELDTNNDGLLSRTELGGSPVEGEGEGEGEGEEPWPGMANAYSWDGSWNPEEGELPPDGFFDDVYFDGHEVGGSASPLLPPGNWDFLNTNTQQLSPLANFDSFEELVGTINLIVDGNMAPFGWRVDSVIPDAMLVNFRANPYHGSSGTDIVDVGLGGTITLTDQFATGDGPDMVRYGMGSAADWRTGSDLTGNTNDNDLVIGGTATVLALGIHDVRTSTVHTGPGRDLVFMNNMERAAIDLGNGADGRTDTTDPDDGDDMLVIGNHFLDNRVYGGGGNDTFVWYLDEANRDIPLLKNSFFGGGGWEPATWDDTGTDRIVLVVPVDTVVVGPEGENAPGVVRVIIKNNYSPTQVSAVAPGEDALIRYVSTAGISPDGRHTLVFDYNSADGHITTGHIFLTAIEEMQIGLGESARVYRLDDKAGKPILAEDLEPLVDIPIRATYEAIMDDFATP